MIERVTVPLPSTLFDTQRSTTVDLPMHCKVAAASPWFVGAPILLWIIVGLVATNVAIGNSWWFALFASVIAVFAACYSAQLIARLVIGDQSITIDSQGIIDTRYGSNKIPWIAFKSASTLYAKGWLQGVMLNFREPLMIVPPLLGRLAATAIPLRPRQQMMVELVAVENREVVASAIRYLVDHRDILTQPAPPLEGA